MIAFFSQRLIESVPNAPLAPAAWSLTLVSVLLVIGLFAVREIVRQLRPDWRARMTIIDAAAAPLLLLASYLIIARMGDILNLWS